MRPPSLLTPRVPVRKKKEEKLEKEGKRRAFIPTSQLAANEYLMELLILTRDNFHKHHRSSWKGTCQRVSLVVADWNP